MTLLTVYDDKLRRYVSQTFGEKILRYSKKLPVMCRFSDFIISNYTESYHIFICECFKNHEIPFSGNSDFYYRETIPVCTEILNVYVHRTDHLSCRIDTVVNTAFSNGKNVYKFRFCVTGTFSAAEKCNFFRFITPYSKSYIPEENLLSEYLVPYLSKGNLDAEAETILQLYYPEALQSPVPVNAVELARNMGYTVRKARLSDNNSKLGSIFFEKRDICCWIDGKQVIRTVAANTILIDIEAQQAHGCNVNDIIIHECVHAYEHYLFYYLQKICLSNNMAEIPEFEDYAECTADDKTLQWIEHQAIHLSPRIRMPLAQTAVKAAELYDKYSGMPETIAYERIIDDLSEFYDVPKITARNRLVELGYTHAENIRRFANGKAVPGFISSVRLEWNQTYTIDFMKLVNEYQRNEDLRELLNSGQYLYVEGHLCLNDDKYIWMRNNSPCLSGYARSHIDECCILFTLINDSGTDKYVPGVLNCKARRGAKKFLYEVSGNAVEQFKSIQKIFKEMPALFGETLTYHMTNINMTVEKLAELSLMSERTITRMRNPKNKLPSLESIIAVSVGLSLYPELSSDLLQKADVKLHADVPLEMCYQVMLRTMYRDSIQTWNDFLCSNGFYPLREDKLAAEA